MKSVSASIVSLAGAVCMSAGVLSRPGSGEGAVALWAGGIVAAAGLAIWAFSLVPRGHEP